MTSNKNGQTLVIKDQFSEQFKKQLIEESKWTPIAFEELGIKPGLLTDKNGRKKEVIVFKNDNYTKLYSKELNKKGWQFFDGNSALFRKLDSDEIILCEGEWDMLAMYEAGFKNVDTLSTGCQSTNSDTLATLRDKQITILYDCDEAGLEAADKLTDVLIDLNCSVKKIDLTNYCNENENDIRDIMIRVNNPYQTVDLILKSSNYIEPYSNSESIDTTIHYPITNPPKVVKKFVDIFKDNTEAPEPYLHAAIMAVLSTVVGNRLYLNGSPSNDYYLLVGKSGSTKKSTVLGYAQKLMKHIIELDGHKKLSLGDNTYDRYKVITSGTEEGLETSLQIPGRHIMLCIDEYKRVFDISKRQGQNHYITSLTAKYTLESFTTVLREKEFSNDNYSLTILGASTKAWLSDFGSNENVSGGFVNRHLVVYCKPSGKYIPIRDEVDQQSLRDLAEEIYRKIPDQKTSLRFSAVGEKAYREFYEKIGKEIDLAEDNEADLMAREMDHAVKIAALSAHFNDQNEVEADDIYYGLSWAKASTKALLQLNSRDTDSFPEKRLLNMIKKTFKKKASPVTKTDIGKHYGGNQNANKKALENLISRKKLVPMGNGYVPISE